MKSRILLIEDHDSLRASLSACLEQEGFHVHSVASLMEARQELKSAPDLIVLDWMLPDGQGIDLLKELRHEGRVTPVIFLTARADAFDKVLSLELGANDYMTKPFEPRELVARIRVRLREASGIPIKAFRDSETTLTVGALSIDRGRHKVHFRNREIELARKEYDLLVLFAESPERAFSRDEILNKVWGYEVFPTTRTVDTHVLLLRQKLDDALIETVRSVGYRFKPTQ